MGNDVSVAVFDAYRTWRQPTALAPDIAVLTPTEATGISPLDSFHSLAPCGWDWDVIFAQNEVFAPICAQLIRRRAIPLVSVAHLPSSSGFSYFETTEVEQRKLALEAQLFRLSTAIVAPSRATADELVRTQLVDPAEVHTVPLGVSRTATRVASFPSSGRTRVLWVGRLVDQKGIEQLCAVVSSAPHNIEFTIVGSGPLRTQVIEAAAGRANVKLIERLDETDILRAYQDHQIFLSTSVHETFGLTVLEAMGAGLPTIAVDCAALDELLTNDLTGLVVPVGDDDEILAALSKLAIDPDLRQRLGTNARKHASGFTWERHIDAIHSIFEEVVGAT